MWIFLRLLIAAAVFFYRFIFHDRSRKPTGQRDGVDYFESIRKHKGKVQGFRIGLRLKSPAVFQIHEERRSDRFFKALGLSTEMQTGDTDFDRRVYIACDHPFVGTLLQHNREARERVTDIFMANIQRIICDGQVLWLDAKGSSEPSEHDRRLLTELRRKFVVLESAMAKRQSDPFVWRALAIEAATWSLAVYAVTGFLGTIINSERVHLDRIALFSMSLGTGLALAALLSAGVFLWMRGSSRGHVIIVESIVLLAMSLPLGAAQVTMDLNRTMDLSSPQYVSKDIVRAYTTTSRGRRGGKRTHYWLLLDSRPGTPEIPSEYKVNYDIYSQAKKGSRAMFTVHAGGLGLAWVSHIHIQRRENE